MVVFIAAFGDDANVTARTEASALAGEIAAAEPCEGHAHVGGSRHEHAVGVEQLVVRNDDAAELFPDFIGIEIVGCIEDLEHGVVDGHRLVFEQEAVDVCYAAVVDDASLL